MKIEFNASSANGRVPAAVIDKDGDLNVRVNTIRSLGRETVCFGQEHLPFLRDKALEDLIEEGEAREIFYEGDSLPLTITF